MVRNTARRAAAILLACSCPFIVVAQDVVAPLSSCASPPPESGKSRLRFESTPLMLVAHELEEQGESAFYLQYSSPAAECLVETFKLADATVTVSYNPFEKGLSTLVYRATVERPSAKSEVLVLYSGTAGFVSGGDYVFHVLEEKDGIVSWYAMYRDPPTYPVVKVLIEQLVKGDAKPLLAVRWPKGAKEAEIVAFDSKRLKK
jgi:hypothetical protein